MVQFVFELSRISIEIAATEKMKLIKINKDRTL